MFRRILLTAAVMAIVLAMTPAAATADHHPHHARRALLSLDGGAPTVGVHAPICELPRDAECSPLEATPFSGGEDAVFRFADDTIRIRRWSIDYSQYPVGDRITLSRSGPSDGTEYKKIEFTAPPPGDWRVFVAVYGTRGGASYE